MITKEQILELATKELKYHYRPYQEPYWYGNKEQLIEFAEKIYQSGRYDGFDSGYDAAFYEHGGY